MRLIFKAILAEETASKIRIITEQPGEGISTFLSKDTFPDAQDAYSVGTSKKLKQLLQVSEVIT